MIDLLKERQAYPEMKSEADRAAYEARVAASAESYYNAMMAAHEAGDRVEDHLDTAGRNAVQKISNANIVPTVVEIVDGRGVGYDLFSRLIKDRSIMLQGGVDETMSAIACATLLFLNSIDAEGKSLPMDPVTGLREKAPRITVYVDSPGGSVIAGLAIYDVMRSISSDITTIGMGMQASMGSILLAAGDERKMTRLSTLMIHQISGGTGGKASEQEISLAYSEHLHEQLKSIYVRHIGLTHEFFDVALEHDTYLTAEQALKMGFISEIITGERRKTAYDDESTRSPNRPGLAAELNRVATAYISNMSADDIVSQINSVSSDGATFAHYRGQMITRLSQFPEFWTGTLSAEKLLKTVAKEDESLAKWLKEAVTTYAREEREVGNDYSPRTLLTFAQQLVEDDAVEYTATYQQEIEACTKAVAQADDSHKVESEAALEAAQQKLSEHVVRVASDRSILQKIATVMDAPAANDNTAEACPVRPKKARVSSPRV